MRREAAARIAIEQIHGGVETGSHVEAAERDMRSALRQLVLAERELQSRALRKAAEERLDAVQTAIPAAAEDSSSSN